MHSSAYLLFSYALLFVPIAFPFCVLFSLFLLLGCGVFSWFLVWLLLLVFPTFWFPWKSTCLLFSSSFLFLLVDWFGFWGCAFFSATPFLEDWRSLLLEKSACFCWFLFNGSADTLSLSFSDGFVPLIISLALSYLVSFPCWSFDAVFFVCGERTGVLPLFFMCGDFCLSFLLFLVGVFWAS
jgi:hypothetical protein